MKSHDATEVSAFHAKTHLSELLRETEKGRSFLIQRRGKPVAWLGPPPVSTERRDIQRFRDTLRTIREDIPGPVDVRALIEEGRR